MSLTTNQGLELPDGTDNANVPLSMTQYNTGVENRLVQRYLSVADRAARNAGPFEGEQSYLADLNRYEWFTGTIWTPLVPVSVDMRDASSFFITSGVYTTAGGPIVGASVVVPPSGRVRVGWTALLNHSAAASQTLIGPQLNTGSVVGGGALIDAANDATASRTTGVGPWTTGGFLYYTGLTAGNAVNAFLMHRVTAITGSVTNRALEIEPA